MKRTLQYLEQWIEEREEGVRTIMGGDFNARGEMEKRERRTKDVKVRRVRGW